MTRLVVSGVAHAASMAVKRMAPSLRAGRDERDDISGDGDPGDVPRSFGCRSRVLVPLEGLAVGGGRNHYNTPQRSGRQQRKVTGPQFMEKVASGWRRGRASA